MKHGKQYLAGQLFATCLFGVSVSAQTFNSGSNGSDGALTLAANKGVVFFDPKDATTFGRVLDPDADGVFHFTTISIGSGTTLKFSGDRFNRPAFLLASGPVQVDGSIDLIGANGVNVNSNDLDLRRKVAVPGSGGYAGGAAGKGGSPPATPGEGPGGGAISCGTNPPITLGCGATFTGGRYLVPLVGGSGGGGSDYVNHIYQGGAAGGGAILIASSMSITVTSSGRVHANGGNGGGAGGDGSGGAIRLVAPTIFLSGNGNLDVGTPVHSGAVFGTPGRIRLEAFSIVAPNGLPAAILPNTTVLTTGLPTNAYLPVSSVKIVSVGGAPVAPYPSGSYFAPPDVTINNGSAVPIVVQATGIPVNTPIKLTVYSDSPVDPVTVNQTYQANLTGTLQSSTATVNVAFPAGLSRSYVRVSW